MFVTNEVEFILCDSLCEIIIKISLAVIASILSENNNHSIDNKSVKTLRWSTLAPCFHPLTPELAVKCLPYKYVKQECAES